MGPSGRWCAPLELQHLPTGMYTAVEAGDGDQPGHVQVHGWKGQVITVHLAGGGGQPQGPRLVSGTV